MIKMDNSIEITYTVLVAVKQNDIYVYLFNRVFKTNWKFLNLLIVLILKVLSDFFVDLK